MNKTDFEIGIIGGGPAGSTAGLMLASAGLDVVLFEKKSFPRETLCGEFLSSEVTGILKRISLYQKFLSLKPNPIEKLKLFSSKEEAAFAGLKFPAYAIKRSVFDKFLLDESRKAGAAVIQPAEVKGVAKSGKGYMLSIKAEDSLDLQVKVKYLIAAYGRRNILDKKLGRNHVNSISRMSGIKVHLPEWIFDKFEKDTIQIFADKGIYCGFNYVSEGTITACFLENNLINKGGAKQQLVTLIKSSGNLSVSLDQKLESEIKKLPLYGAGNIFFGRKSTAEDGILMIGDAAGIIAPLAGDGIAMAMQSAETAAGILIDRKRGNIGEGIVEEIYGREWKLKFYSRLRTAAMIQSSLMNPHILSAGLNLLGVFPGILPYLIRRTRG